jgi:hypothetical protein
VTLLASPLPCHSTNNVKNFEVEIERRTIQKARERMELELHAMEEKYTSGEEERRYGWRQRIERGGWQSIGGRLCSRDGRRRWPWSCDNKRGQHRVRMMALLAEERRKVQEEGGVSVGVGGDELDSLDLENVLVNVFVPRQSRDKVGSRAVPATEAGGSIGDDDKDSMAATFTKINKAEPVKLLDLPGMATKRTRDIIDHAASHFHDAYPAMFATLAQCHASHLNLDNLRDALFTSGVI